MTHAALALHATLLAHAAHADAHPGVAIGDVALRDLNLALSLLADLRTSTPAERRKAIRPACVATRFRNLADLLARDDVAPDAGTPSPTTTAEAIAMLTGPGSLTDPKLGCLGDADQIAVLTILAAFKAQQDAIDEARQATMVAADLVGQAHQTFADRRRLARVVVEANDALIKAKVVV